MHESPGPRKEETGGQKAPENTEKKVGEKVEGISKSIDEIQAAILKQAKANPEFAKKQLSVLSDSLAQMQKHKAALEEKHDDNRGQLKELNQQIIASHLLIQKLQKIVGPQKPEQPGDQPKKSFGEGLAPRYF